MKVFFNIGVLGIGLYLLVFSFTNTQDAVYSSGAMVIGGLCCGYTVYQIKTALKI